MTGYIGARSARFLSLISARIQKTLIVCSNERGRSDEGRLSLFPLTGPRWCLSSLPAEYLVG
jgi:hypothetical protein